MLDDRRVAWLRLWHARVSYVLTAAGIDHVLVKGCTWSPALDIEKVPADVDVLVAPDHFRTAVQVLLGAGFAQAMGAVGEDEVALHSTVLQAPDGPEVDVHRSFPGLDSDPVRTWSVLSASIVPATLGHREIPVLSGDLQVLVAAATAARDGHGSSAARRLVAATDQVDWPAVVAHAQALRATGTLRAGLEAAGLGDIAARYPLDAAPHQFGSFRSAGERRLEEVLSYPWRRRVSVVLHEAWPSDAFLAMAQPGVPARRARGRHLAKLARELPPAAWRVLARRLGRD